MQSIGLAAVSLQGFIDAIERGVVYGWAWNPQRPEERTQVDILHGDKHLATVTAEQFRSDLVDLEIGDGNHAFEFGLPDSLHGDVHSSEIEVRFAGSAVPLPRMRVRPEPRSRRDGLQRPEAEVIATLQDRIAMQEQIIADMSNLLKGLVERLRDLPALERDREFSPHDTELEAAINKQSTILQGLEVYMATFGQSLRDLADRMPQSSVVSSSGSSRFRAMDAAFLVLLIVVVIGFAVAFGDFF